MVVQQFSSHSSQTSPAELFLVKFKQSDSLRDTLATKVKKKTIVVFKLPFLTSCKALLCDVWCCSVCCHYQLLLHSGKSLLAVGARWWRQSRAGLQVPVQQEGTNVRHTGTHEGIQEQTEIKTGAFFGVWNISHHLCTQLTQLSHCAEAFRNFAENVPALNLFYACFCSAVFNVFGFIIEEGTCCFQAPCPVLTHLNKTSSTEKNLFGGYVVQTCWNQIHAPFFPVVVFVST